MKRGDQVRLSGRRGTFRVVGVQTDVMTLRSEGGGPLQFVRDAAVTPSETQLRYDRAIAVLRRQPALARVRRYATALGFDAARLWADLEES